jgi:hypothetical protein
MAIDRRRLLLGAGATAAGVRSARAHDVAPRETSGATASGDRPCLAAAYRDPGGSFGVAVLTADGRELRSIPLPARGHDIAVCPRTGDCVVMARRPGRFGMRFCANRRRPPVVFETRADRHVYGHGVYSADGRLFYATENDFHSGVGRIGVYDMTGPVVRRVGELPSHGVGPHDIARLDGTRHSAGGAAADVLVVANGGFREHPAVGGGRTPLDLDRMRSSITTVDAATGDLLEEHVLPARWRHVSLRHLDVTADGLVVVGGQVMHGQGAALSDDDPAETPLVFTHRRQTPLVPRPPLMRPLLPLSLGPAAARLAGYVSSVAVDAGGRCATVTSARGGIALTWAVGATDGDHHVHVATLADVSGVAAADRAGLFQLTSGHGAIVEIGSGDDIVVPARTLRPPDPSRAWDNHATRLA